MKRFGKLAVSVVAVVMGLVFLFPFQSCTKKGVIEITMLNAHPSTHVAMTPFKEWIKRVEERTNGRVKVKMFWGTLGNVTEFYDMVKNGDVDAASLGSGWAGGRLPMCEIVDLAFESPDVEAGGKILQTLLDQGLLKELDLFKVLEIHSMIAGNLYLTEKKVTSLEQMKGMKIRPIPGVSTQLVESWRAVPVSVRTPDLYMALQKGQIDGLFTGPDNAVGQKLYEVCKYQVKIPTFSGAFVVIMNKQSWNKLPADVQKVIDEVDVEIADFRLKFYQNLAKEAQNTLDAHLEAYNLSPAEEVKWREAAASVTENWISDMESKGFPARKAVEVMRSVVKSYK